MDSISVPKRLAALLLLWTLCVLPLAPVHAQFDSVEPGINEPFVDPNLDVDEWTKKFEGESREVFAKRQAIVDALGLSDRERVADVGAGTGFFSELMADAVGANGLVWALDISPKFAEFMKQRFAQAKRDNIEVVENSVRSTELAESSIDLAFVCDTYHHFEYPYEMLRSLLNALRPRGQLVVVDFDRVPGKSPKWVLDHVRADKQEVRKEIERAGFAFVEEISIDGLDENYMLRFRRR